MRPISVLVPLTVLCLLSPQNLPAQDVIVGPLLDLPEVTNTFDTAILPLENGNMLLTSIETDFSGDSLAHMQTIDPKNGSLLAYWTRPTELRTSLRLVNIGDQILYLEPGDAEVTNEELWLQTLNLEGDPEAPPAQINPIGTRPTHTLDMAQLLDGSLVAIWWDIDPAGDDTLPPSLLVQRFSPQGDLLGPVGTVTVQDDDNQPARGPRVIALDHGGFLITWTQSVRGFGRVYDVNGQAGSLQVLADTAFELNPVVTAQGNPLLVWTNALLPAGGEVMARRIDLQGQPSPDVLELNGPVDRSRTYSQVTADQFGNAWATWLEGADTVLRRIGPDNSLGNLVAVPSRDGGAPVDSRLAVGPGQHALLAWQQGAGNHQWEARTLQLDTSCPGSDTMLCLHQGRFQVEVEWTDHAGDIGPGRVVPFQSSDSGLFWFFNEANWEVMVKVINGCDFNGFYWIFSAATTDVAYDLKVTDTTTGLEQIYSNGLGEPAPANTDTMALMSCDHGPP